MAENSGRRRKPPKRGNRMVIFVIWTAVIAIIAAGVWMMITVFFKNTDNEMLKVAYPKSYSEYVERYSNEYKLEPSLVYAVIRTESSFNPDAESSVGACGLMQIMPSSFEWMCEKRGEYRLNDELFDPETNIDYGCWLLRYFYDYYGSETCAVAAYNAGFAVSEWLEDPNCSPDGKTLSVIPYPETEAYVEKVQSAKEMYIKIY